MKDSKEQYCQECHQKKESNYCDHCQKETNSFFKVNIFDTATAKESLKLKQKQQGIGGWRKEVFQGFKPSDKEDVFPDGVELHRNIDREKNQYDEVVKDYKTCIIAHECHEPLSEHVGHGSAKYSNK